jgi:hypothetical protein
LDKYPKAEVESFSRDIDLDFYQNGAGVTFDRLSVTRLADLRVLDSITFVDKSWMQKFQSGPQYEDLG